MYHYRNSCIKILFYEIKEKKIRKPSWYNFKSTIWWLYPILFIRVLKKFVLRTNRNFMFKFKQLLPTLKTHLRFSKSPINRKQRSMTFESVVWPPFSFINILICSANNFTSFMVRNRHFRISSLQRKQAVEIR
jgi:hypothetical protein